MSFVTQTTLVRYVRWGVVAASIATTAACGGGGGGGGGAPTATGNAVNAVSAASTGIHLVLNTNRITGVAPLAVVFDTLGSTSNNTNHPFHEIRYSWDFGDQFSSSKFWKFGTKANQTIKASKNIAYGPVVGHVFEEPGLYKVIVDANDGSSSEKKEVTITVTNPNSEFSSSTVCISNTSTPVPGINDCPPFASAQQVSSWANIGTLSGTYKRILLKRGDVWGVNGMASLSSGPGILAAYGAGSDPVINVNDNFRPLWLSGVHDWRIVDLEFTSSVVGAAVNEKVPLSFMNSNYVTVLRVRVSNVYTALSATNTNGLSIVDSEFKDTYPVVGNIISWFENADNLFISGSKMSNSATTHVARVQGASKAFISNSQFDSPSSIRHALTIRGKAKVPLSDWTGTWTENVVVSDSLIDGGSASSFALYVTPQNSSSAERLRDILIERNVIRARTATPAVMHVAKNLYFKNNLVIGYADFSLALAGGNSAGSPDPSGAYVYNNTFYKPNALTTPNYSSISLSGPMDNIFIKNNIGYGIGNSKNGSQSENNSTFFYAYPGSGTYQLENNSLDVQVGGSSPFNPSDPTPTIPVNLVDINIAKYVPYGYAKDRGVRLNVWEDLTARSISSTEVRSMGAVHP